MGINLRIGNYFRKLVDFHSFVYRFLGATHYLFHQHHYILALLFAFIQLLFAFFGQETLLFVFETFSSFGNIFVFGMLIFSIAFYLQQYFYMQNKNKNDIEVFVANLKYVTIKIHSIRCYWRNSCG